MTILDKIIAHKRHEVATQKTLVTIKELESQIKANIPVPQLRDFLANPKKNGIIAEFKRQSPSKGLINGRALPDHVASAYQQAGVSAMSVLTDINFFGGHNTDLKVARTVTNIPILRKDFTVDEYQIIEARAIGASAILLIASCLTKEEIQRFAKLAVDLGLDVLFEVHNREELDKYCDEIGVVGVNNRNLKTFEVNLQNSIDLLQHFPAGVRKVAESGISNIETIHMLKKEGFDGFLIGEGFMKTPDPGQACIDFCKQL
jgi:indole-3-glycerol phosphate synthase